MSGDKEVKYEITGNADGLADAMVKAQQVIAGATDGIKGQLEGVGHAFEKVTKVFGTLAAVAAGGAFFKEAIKDSRALAGEVGSLSKRLAITTDEASALNTALGDIGSDAETYIGAFDKFAQQIRKNEKGLNDMGIKTRDANGNLRDSNELYREALSEVGKYAPGLDQTTAAMSLFGKSVDEVMKLQKLNNGLIEEAKQKNEELGLTITQEGLASSKAYGMAMNDLGDVMEGVKNTIGQAVMPVFTELAQYLSESGPYVVDIFKGAMTGLLLVFRAVQMAVKIVAGVIFEFISSTIDQVGNLGDLFSKILHGDWAGALATAKAIGARTGEAYKRAFVDNVAEAYSEAVSKSEGDMQRVWGKGTSGAPKGGSKRMGDMGKEPADKSDMNVYETRLAQQKEAFALLTNGREMDKQGEIAYWQYILQHESVSGADKVKITQKIANLTTEVLTRGYQQQQQIAEEHAKAEESLALGKIDSQRAAADALLSTERITATQRAQLEVGFENEKHRIQADALQARIDLLQQDPDVNVVELARLHDQVLLEEQQFQTRKLQLETAANKQATAEGMQMQNALQGQFQSILTNLGNGTLRLRNLFQTVGKAMLNTFIGIFEQIAAKWLAMQVMRMAGEKVTALAGVTSAAAMAGAGGVASMAAAPYPIDMGAPAFGAAMSALAMSFAPMASAAGGFDIPSGINPLVQAHAEEMILPAKHANVIRAIADGGGGAGGGGGDVHLHGVPMPGGFWMFHQDELVKVIKDAKRSRRL